PVLPVRERDGSFARAPPPLSDERIPRPESSATMVALANLINTVVNIYIVLLFANAILSWLVAFNVVNTRNRFVYVVGDVLYRLTEPALRPIRRILPNLGGIDISP